MEGMSIWELLAYSFWLHRRWRVKKFEYHKQLLSVDIAVSPHLEPLITFTCLNFLGVLKSILHP
jgi:hypothetical protein